MGKTITVAQAIVNSLKKENIEHVFCVPGESFLPILDALHDEPDIRVISARHEGGASFMAESFAKCTQKPSVVLATRGVGASNLTIGVHTAYQDSTPMIVLLGQVHRQFIGKEGFQEVDLERFFAPIAKWAVEIKGGHRISEVMQKAMRIATTGRPGPVVISLPEDVLPEKIETPYYKKLTRPTPAPSNGEVERVVNMLQKADRPLLIVGGGIKHATSEREIVLLSERFKLPVLVSFRRHDCFPHDHPHFIGHLGLGESKSINHAINESDLIIALGTRLSEVTTKDYTLIKNNHKLIHIDIDNQVLGKAFEPDIGIVSDAKEMILALYNKTVKPIWESWTKKLRQAYVTERTNLQKNSPSINTSIIKQLQEKVQSNLILTNDAGNFASWLHDFFIFNEPHSYIGPTSGAMGYGLPAAIGAKLAFPHKTVISLSGDGGFLMTAQELETAVRYHIPIICLVFNNQMYGTIRMHQEIHYPEKVIATDLGNVSFQKLAESVGAKGYKAKTIDQFNDAFEQSLQNDTVSVIEILTDREQISVQRTIADIRNKDQLN